MREILFKAKREDTKEWMEGTVFFPESGITVMFPIGSTSWEAEEVDPETVCQYTGLTDKNGRKVFEGDILVYEDDYTSKTKCIVKYINASFQAVWPNDWDNETLDNGFKVYSEVIGNIHDEEGKK